MPCRYDSSDPRICDRCGAFLWVVEEGLFCGECGVTMPCSMQVRPFPSEFADRRTGRAPETTERSVSTK